MQQPRHGLLARTGATVRPFASPNTAHLAFLCRPACAGAAARACTAATAKPSAPSVCAPRATARWSASGFARQPAVRLPPASSRPSFEYCPNQPSVPDSCSRVNLSCPSSYEFHQVYPLLFCVCVLISAVLALCVFCICKSGCFFVSVYFVAPASFAGRFRCCSYVCFRLREDSLPRRRAIKGNPCLRCLSSRGPRVVLLGPPVRARYLG